MPGKRRSLPPGAKWITLPSGARRVELVVDIGIDPATGRRRQTRKRFESADDAIEEYSRIKQETRAGTFVGRSNITVSTACRQWLDGKQLRQSTLAGYRHALKPVMDVYGELPLQRLTKRDLDSLIPLLRSGVLQRRDGRKVRPWAPRTVNLMLFVLGEVLEDAQRQGLIVRNVAALVDRVSQKKKEMQTYTEAEVRKLLTYARSDRLEQAWHLALSGLRRGEVCGLRWSDVDFDAATLTIRTCRVVVDGEVLEEEPKTERGKRTLPLTEPMMAMLRRALARQEEEREEAGEAYRDDGHVVRDEVGRAPHPDTVSSYWDAITKAAGVRRIRLHDARHTCGTLLHLQGTPIAVISAWLGHADAGFTMRTYVHSQDGALRDAATTLGSVTDV